MGNLSLANVTALLVRDSGGIWLPVHSLSLVPDLVADNTTPGVERVITLDGGGTSELEIGMSNIPQNGTEGGWLLRVVHADNLSRVFFIRLSDVVAFQTEAEATYASAMPMQSAVDLAKDYPGLMPQD